MYLTSDMKQAKKTLSEIKRESIVKAAKSAFKKYGVQATSMDKLAEIAQVSKRTVYNHFATKEELVLHLISELWMQSMVQVETEYQADRALEDQLIALLVTEIDLVGSQEYIDLARVAFGHFFYKPQALKKEVEKFNAQETALQRWLKAAVSDNKLKKMDTEEATKQLHSLIKGSCFWPQFLQVEPVLNKQQKARLAKESVSMFLSYYKK